MKKLISVLLAVALVLGSITVSLTGLGFAVPAEASSTADPNLAKGYTNAAGQVTWDATAGAWPDQNIDSTANSVYGGYSWRFGVPDGTGHITVTAAGLEAATTYYFSYIYSMDYKIIFEGVQAAGGATVLEGCTGTGGTVTYPAAVLESALPHGDRAYRVGFCFTTTSAGDYSILLKAGKTWQNTGCNWSCTQLSDLVLAKQAKNNLLANVQTGNGLTFGEGIGLQSQNTLEYTLYGGYSWRFNPSVDTEIPITSTVALAGNHVYSFSFVYSNDYKVQLQTDNLVSDPDGNAVSGILYDPQTAPVAVSGARSAHTVTVQFTTGKAGNYTLNMCTRKQWKNTDGWDFATLSDLCLVDMGLSENLIADYTIAGGNISYESTKGIWDQDKYGGDYAGYWWKFPWANQDPNFAFKIKVNAADLKPNTYYSFGFTGAMNLYTGLNAEKTAGFTVVRDSTGVSNNTAVLKTGASVENCVITLKYAAEAWEGAGSDPWASAIISNLKLTELKGNVTLGVSAQGGGVATASKTAAAVGEKVTLTAVPNRLESFTGWYTSAGVLLSNEAVFELEAAENLNAVARFTSLNQAAAYTKANGDVDFSSNAGVLETDTNNGYYNSSRSWKLSLNGTSANSLAEITVKNSNLKGNRVWQRHIRKFFIKGTV